MNATADAHACAQLARLAGDVLLDLRATFVEGEDPKSRGRRGDAASQAALAAALTERFPGDAVLSEEARDPHERLTADRVWIIDPLDGTREYGEGRDDWAVHVALWESGELAAGAVAIPGEGLVLDSATVDPATVAPAPGAPAPGTPTPETPETADPTGASSDRTPTRLAVSRSRPPSITEPVRAALDAELVPMGSAGVKIAAVVRGQVDAYVHAGGQYEWDSAAPIAVARAAGLHTSRVDGSPLAYNGADPYLPDLVVCRPALAPTILAAIARATREESA